ncbi:MAG: transporter [Microbacteriaceae bacterium]|jgi:MFS family permease|nr:transporter [Microbacteriaceae bacterium]
MTATMERPPRPAPLIVHRRRGMVVVLLCVMYFISYFDRTNIATAGPSIMASTAKGGLGLSPFEFGLATSVFAVGYAVFQILGGRIGEKLGPRRGLLVLGVLWGAATLASGLAGGLISLLVARAVLGLSESATFPTATQAMSRWIPRDRNGMVQGIVHSASRLGTAAAPIVVAALIAAYDWRFSFIAVGILSVLWAVVWFVLFRDQPKQVKGISQLELSEIPAIAKPKDTPPVPWKRLARSILPVTAVDFGYGWVAWVFFTWIPSLLASTYKQDVAHYGLLTSLILAGGVIGDTLGGVLSDALLRRTGNARNARRTFLLIGFIGAAVCMIPILFTPPLVVTVVTLALAFFFLELTNAQLWSIPMDIAPTWSGAASGMMNTGFAIAGVVSAIAGGSLITWASGGTGFTWLFGISIVILIGATILAGIMRPKPVDPIAEQPLAVRTV